MRILVVTQYFPPEVGAPQVRLAGMTSALRKLGVEVEVVAALPNYPKGEIFDDYRRKLVHTETWGHDIPVHRVWLAAAQGSGARRLLSFATFAAMLPLALRRATKPDVVFVNSSPLTFAPVALWAAKRWGAVPVLGVSDLWPDGLVEIGALKPGRVLDLMHRLERKMYADFALMTPVTNGIWDTLEKEKHVPASKLAFLPNGVDTALFRQDQSRVSLPGVTDFDGSVFAFPGTMGYFQGLDIVLSAMETLRDREDIRFAFIGDGNERSRLEGEVSDRGLTNVIFRDAVPPEEFAGILPQITAGVVCLRDIQINEGARPGKTFPMMASKVPVVFSGSGEMAKMVADAKCGIVVPPGDADALAMAFRQLADDPGLARQLGENGANLVHSEFSWEPLVRSWLDRVEEVVAETELPAVPQ